MVRIWASIDKRNSEQIQRTFTGSMTISFADIIHGRDARVRVTDDGLLHAIDVVMVVTGKNGNHSAKIIRDLRDDVFGKDKYQERNMSTRYFQRVYQLCHKTLKRILLQGWKSNQALDI
jgi:hypothetical protein